MERTASTTQPALLSKPGSNGCERIHTEIRSSTDHGEHLRTPLKVLLWSESITWRNSVWWDGPVRPWRDCMGRKEPRKHRPCTLRNKDLWGSLCPALHPLQIHLKINHLTRDITQILPDLCKAWCRDTSLGNLVQEPALGWRTFL